MVDLSGYRLTFDDEFNTRSISQNGVGTTYADIRSEWRFDANSDIGFGRSSFVDSASGYDPFSLQNGALSITAAPPGTTASGYPGSWESGLITTQGNFSQTYGYFEIRADFSNNANAWDAFWLLPNQQTPDRNNSGSHQELDVVEHYGNNDKGVYSTIHTTDVQGSTPWQVNRQVYSEIPNPAGYHTYGVNWQADKISFYVDGQFAGSQATPSDLHSPMYLLANLAVQSNAPATGSPFTSNIDYIRVYSNATNATAVPQGRVSSPDGTDPGLYGATAAVPTTPGAGASIPASTGTVGSTPPSTGISGSAPAPTGMTGSVPAATATSGSTPSSVATSGATPSTVASGPSTSASGSTPAATGMTGSASAPPGTPETATSANPAPCYCTDTHILTIRGEVAVQELRVDDVVVTASGQSRPVRWIGSRHYPEQTAPRADRPVRIRAGALAEGVPARDLWVSPDHALFVDDLFVAAGHLVNGRTITRGEPVADLTYWHVELDAHDLLLAENTPAESFLAMPGLYRHFDGERAEPIAQVTSAPYAERAQEGPRLTALRRRLILHAGLSLDHPGLGDLRGQLDLCEVYGGNLRVAGWARDAAHPNGPVCLDVVVDGTVAALTLAEVYRPDLAEAGVGDGRHGFDLGFDEPLTSGTAHTIEVHRSADGALIGAMRVDATGVWSRTLVA